jgi:hypothetical protein
MTDKMREEFETAYVEGLVLRCGEGFRDTALYSLSEKKPNGDYQHYTDGIAWWAWQASREALVVEWPDHYDYTNSDIAGAAILDCRTAFGKAVKVKP